MSTNASRAECKQGDMTYFLVMFHDDILRIYAQERRREKRDRLRILRESNMSLISAGLVMSDE